MEFLSHQRMSPHVGGVSAGGGGQNQDLSATQSVSTKRQRVDVGGGHGVTPSSSGATGGGYDHAAAVNFFTMDAPSLVVSKAEYEVMAPINGIVALVYA